MNYLEEGLAEPEAATEAQIMGEVFLCGSNMPTARYDFASDQVTTIKHTLATLSNEALLDLYEEAHSLDTIRGYAAAKLLASTLEAVPYLDTERALRLYTQALEPEEIAPETAEFLPYGLIHLTKAAGDEAIPLWRQALDHNHTAVTSVETSGIVLATLDDYPSLSEIGVAALRNI